MGYVYCIINTQNSMKYVGCSKNDPKKDRIQRHLSDRSGNRLVKAALQEFGRDAFTYKILETDVSADDVLDLEAFYIQKFNCVSPNGYNLTTGGKHPRYSGESRRRMAQALQGKKRGPQSDKHRQKLSNSNKGKKRSVETRRNLSLSHQGQIPWNKGKKHTEESIRKMCESHKNRIPNYRSPYYAPAKLFWDSLPTEIPLKDRRKLFHQKFQNVSKTTRNVWIRRWIRQTS